ncbi:MAG TPA: hypothetical protein VEA79_15565 [Phenylobacterium sp.]|nr:hypothetical protein [Phenylobacterium sp.]
MIALIAALALFAQDAAGAAEATATAPAAPSAPSQAPFPVGAPTDDYGFVSWCYGSLDGWLQLRDRAMPEVERIEKTYRRPGSSLADDMKVYADLEKEGRRNLKVFAGAIEAAEKASVRPISAQGAEALKKGRSVWAGAANITNARLAQEWMSWALPARCEPTAQRLAQNAALMGQAFNPGVPAEAPASEAGPAPDAVAADAAGDPVQTMEAAPAADPATEEAPQG